MPFTRLKVALRTHATQAIMDARGLTRFQARVALAKCENATTEQVTQALGAVDTSEGALLACYAHAGMPTGAFGDGSIISKFGGIFQNAINWISDPANRDKLIAGIENIMKILAIVLPLFGMATPTTMTAALFGGSVDIDKLKVELADLQVLQLDLADKQIILSAAQDALTAADAAATIAGSAVSEAQTLAADEITYCIQLLNLDPNAVDPTPNAPPAPPDGTATP